MPPAPRFFFTFSQATSKFFRLYTLSTNEWTFLSPIGLSQSASLLGRCRPGLSLKELIRVIGLTRSLAVSLRPPLPAAFPGPLGRRLRGHPAFAGLEVLFGCPTTRRASLPTSSFDL